jgi:hypothetical protein
MMQRFSKTKRSAKKTKPSPMHVVKTSIVNIFDDVSDFVVDGLKDFPMEDGNDFGVNGKSRKIS